jgi:hypothetical protein
VAVITPVMAEAAAGRVSAAGRLSLVGFRSKLPHVNLVHRMEQPHGCTLGVLRLHPAELARRDDGAMGSWGVQLWAQNLSAQRAAPRRRAVSRELLVLRANLMSLGGAPRAPGAARRRGYKGRQASRRFSSGLCKGRLEGMARGGWVLHVVTTDAWRMLTAVSEPLAITHVVRRMVPVDRNREAGSSREGLGLQPRDVDERGLMLTYFYVQVSRRVTCGTSHVSFWLGLVTS